jgi:hypothetical protein
MFENVKVLNCEQTEKIKCEILFSSVTATGNRARIRISLETNADPKDNSSILREE